ncbi:MAG: hypothetical protein AAF211_05940, partial [Myxococcota bacterium]
QGSGGTVGDTEGSMGDALPPIALGTGRTAVRLFAGQAHVCALLDDGAAKCWGENASAELGLGDREDRGNDAGEMGDALPDVDLGTGRAARMLALGDGHTCALLTDGGVKCWGDNTQGQLGVGDTETRGDEPGEMGDTLPDVDLGTGRTATALVAGGTFTCALLDDQTVKCWGSNASGSLGQGDTEARGDATGEMGDDLPPIDLGTGRTARRLAATYGSVCALLDDDRVKCWGSNSSGQLGQGDRLVRGSQTNQMGDDLMPVDLGAGVVEQVSGQGSVFCARFVDGTVKCWGANQAGQLGVGDTDRRGDDPGEMGTALQPVDL